MALRWNRSFFSLVICFSVWLMLSATGAASDTAHSTIDFGHAKPQTAKPAGQTKPAAKAAQSSSQNAVGKAAAAGPLIKVGLFQTRQPLSLMAKGSLLVRDGVSGREVQKLAAGDTVQVQVQNGKILLNKKSLAASLLEFSAA